MSEHLQAKHKALKLDADFLVGEIANTVKSATSGTLVSVSLYLPVIEGKPVKNLGFRRIAYEPKNLPPKDFIKPVGNESIFCGAHWGDPQCYSPFLPDRSDDSSDATFLLQEGENVLCLIPLPPPSRGSSQVTESLAIVRIGLQYPSSLDEEKSTDFLNLIGAAVLAGSSATLLKLVGD